MGVQGATGITKVTADRRLRLEGASLSGATRHTHRICENSLISDSSSVPPRRGQSSGGARGEVSVVPSAQD